MCGDSRLLLYSSVHVCMRVCMGVCVDVHVGCVCVRVCVSFVGLHTSGNMKNLCYMNPEQMPVKICLIRAHLTGHTDAG